MNTPFFSVIVASCNAGARLPATIDSILAQTFEDYEIIIKDAGSTDGSLSAVPSDPRIRLICRRDRGIYDGMNEGVACAAGEFLYFLNCGDRLHDRNVLEHVYGAIRAHGRGTDYNEGEHAIWYGDVFEMRTGQIVAANPSMTHFAMFRTLPCHQACFYDRALFAQRGFDLHYIVRADYEHFLWAVICGGAATHALPLVIADYEGGGFSEKKKNREISAKEHREIAERYFSPKERTLFTLYLLATLQPLREKIAHGKRTAALYDGIKNAVYRHKRKRSGG